MRGVMSLQPYPDGLTIVTKMGRCAARSISTRPARGRARSSSPRSPSFSAGADPVPGAQQRDGGTGRGTARNRAGGLRAEPANPAQRDDDAPGHSLAGTSRAYVPFFPLGGFSPLQSSTLSNVAARLGATPLQVAAAWFLSRAPNIL